MSKLNRPKVAPFASTPSPIKAAKVPTLNTFEGAPAHARDAKSDLFLLAVSNFVGENTFYEKAGDRDKRYRELVHQVAVADPDWMSRFLPWLRNEANMRSASVVGAVEAARAMVKAKIPGGRQVVDSILVRADEPGDALSYFVTNYGRSVPKPIKRGIADAASRLYWERSVLKYDTASKGYRFADVLELCHAAPTTLQQTILFKHSIDRRHGRDGIPDSLTMTWKNQRLRDQMARDYRADLIDPQALSEAGMTWEDVLSLAGSKIPKRALWEAIIPSMGYMALLRNLRNFDEAGIGDRVAVTVARKLADPDEVGRSRQLPFRFWSAYKEVSNLRWGPVLEKALGHCLKNITAWPGRTLVLVDTSASMTSAGLSVKSKVSAAVAAAVFGMSLKCKDPDNVNLVEFADRAQEVQVNRGASVLKAMEAFLSQNGRVGHGTDVAGAVVSSYRGQDRVIIISDMQTMNSGYGRSVSNSVPANIPIYAFNLGGYSPAAMATNMKRMEIGGLTDQTFAMISNVETAGSADWPF